MFLKSSDIACFLYCPYIRKYNNAKETVLSELTPFEKNVREAIKNAERNCLYKNSEINTRKILNAWDKTWWPYVTKHNISPKKAKSLSLKASFVFSDYCSYDISSYTYPCIGINLTSSKQIGTATVESTIDIAKVDLSIKKRNIILIDMGRKNMSNRDIALDPDVRTKAYCFYQGKGETVTYIYVDLNEKNKKLHVKTAHFRPSDMENIRKMINLAKIGIENNVDYMNRWNCKQCNLCPKIDLEG